MKSRREARAAVAAWFRENARGCGVYTPGHDAVLVVSKTTTGAQKVLICQLGAVWIAIIVPSDAIFPGLKELFGQDGLPVGSTQIDCPAPLVTESKEAHICAWEAVRDFALQTYSPLYFYTKKVAARLRGRGGQRKFKRK